jgi:ElaB/YqjD/DUF883 family membrane-anchored ribosome-binding protein
MVLIRDAHNFRGGGMIERHNGKDSWKVTIETARGHFDEGFRDLARAAEQAKEQGQEAWNVARSRARETWVDVREKGLSAWEETRERGEVLLKDSEQYVRRNPAKAIGFAALAGVFLGLFLTSGRNATDGQ